MKRFKDYDYEVQEEIIRERAKKVLAVAGYALCLIISGVSILFLMIVGACVCD